MKLMRRTIVEKEVAELCHRTSAMTDAVFSVRPHLRESQTGVFGNKDGVVAETFGAALLGSDVPFDFSLEQMFLSAYN